MRQIALAAAITLATATVAVLLWRFRGAATLFLLSLGVAAMVRPFVDMLEPRVGRAGALAIVYISGLAFAAVFVYQISRGFLHELDSAAERLGSLYERLRTVDGNPGPIHRLVIDRLPPAATLYSDIGGARTTELIDEALGVGRNVIDVVGQLLITLALSVYWSVNHESFERLWLSLVPIHARLRARDIWRAVEEAVGVHLRSELAQSVLAALLVALAFRGARFPTPMLPAIATGILRLVPFFGPLLCGAVAFLAGLGRNALTATLAAAYTVGVVLALDAGASRQLFRVRHASPTLTVALAVALVDVYGVAGLLVASTLAIAIQVYLERLIATHPRRARRPSSLAAIEQRLQVARRRLAELPASQAPQLGSVINRLEVLTSEARRAL